MTTAGNRKSQRREVGDAAGGSVMPDAARRGWKQVILRDICERIDYGYTASAKVKPVGPKFLRITDIVPPPPCESALSALGGFGLLPCVAQSRQRSPSNF